MHEDDSRACCFVEREIGTWFAAGRVVETAERDVLEGRVERDVSIGDHSNAGLFQVAHDHRMIRPQIVVAEDGELAVGGGDVGQERREAIDVRRAHRHEVASEKQNVRLERREQIAGVGEQSRVGGGPRVEVGRKPDAERRSRIGRTGGWLSQLEPAHRRAHPTLEPHCPRQQRSPVPGTENGVEEELDLATIPLDPPIARPAIGQSSTDGSSSSVSGATDGFFLGRPPFPFAACASSIA